MFGVTLTFSNDSECTLYYIVEYKKDFETQYTAINPNPTASPVTITDLDACTTYNVRITRRCCNGQNSNIATTSFTTGNCG